jgi:predicted nucleic acid-binding protein
VTVLVDTPVIVDHLRNDPRAIALMADLFAREDRVWAATPTRTEIIAGLRPPELQPMGRLFAVMSWLDIDTAIADAAGELARRYHASHGGIDTVDYLIAAAAESIGASLVTLNVRHFPMFPDLEPAYR